MSIRIFVTQVLVPLILIIAFAIAFGGFVAYMVNLPDSGRIAEGICLQHGYPETKWNQGTYYCIKHSPDEVMPVDKLRGEP